jgi:hypothetical protein
VIEKLLVSAKCDGQVIEEKASLCEQEQFRAYQLLPPVVIAKFQVSAK